MQLLVAKMRGLALELTGGSKVCGKEQQAGKEGEPDPSCEGHPCCSRCSVCADTTTTTCPAVTCMSGQHALRGVHRTLMLQVVLLCSDHICL
jgi:hypothetical protein